MKKPRLLLVDDDPLISESLAFALSADTGKAIAREFEDAFEIGSIQHGPRGCTVSGTEGRWNSAEDWSVTHRA